MILMLILW